VCSERKLKFLNCFMAHSKISHCKLDRILATEAGKGKANKLSQFSRPFQLSKRRTTSTS
jgi:hypothetical protein